MCIKRGTESRTLILQYYGNFPLVFNHKGQQTVCLKPPYFPHLCISLEVARYFAQTSK